MCILAGHGYFLVHRKADTIVFLAKFCDGVFFVEFLQEVTRGKTKYSKSPILIALMQGLKRLKLRCEAAFAGGIDQQQYLAAV